MNPIKALIYYDAVVSNRDDLAAENARLRAEFAGERERANEVTAEHAELFDLLLAAEARIAKLREALVKADKLALSVYETWGAFERALRGEIGNTNYSCIKDKLDDFREALAAIDALLKETGGGDE